MTDFDLGNLHLIVDRPGATPAPNPDPGLHRYAPNADRQTLTALTADTDALIAASRQTRADLARARGTDIDLPEVAA